MFRMPDPGTILAEPKKKRFTREEYDKMVEIGLLEGQHVELIDGEIIQMAPQLNRHAVTVGLVDRALRRVVGDQYWVRLQAPINASEDSEPEPDVAIVTGSPRDYSEHPRKPLLVVEVSETMYRFDSRTKAGLYASVGIEDYWIVNLNANRLEVYREPVADETKPFAHRYADVKMLAATEVVTCLAFPQAQIKVADLLP